MEKSGSYLSVASQPETMTDEWENYLEECMERIVAKYSARMTEQIAKGQLETHTKIDNMNENLTTLNGRLTIFEDVTKKAISDLNEKVLVNENQIIANTNKISPGKCPPTGKNRNRALRDTVDNFDQASRSSNMFIAGLTKEQATKEGFINFCTEI